MHPRLLSLAALGSLALTVAAPVFAQDGSGITMRGGVQIIPQVNMEARGDFALGPTRFDLTLAPGDSKTIEIELTNRMGKLAGFTFDQEDFSPAENEGEQTKLYGKNRGPYSAKDWITPLIGSISLNHADRAYIPVTIRVPLDADPGDHYAAIMAKRDLAPGEAKGGVSVISRVGALFLITVEGPVTRKGTLLSLETQKPFYTRLLAPIRLRAKNEGTVRMYPEGSIVIRNILGVTVDELPIKDWVVLRGSTRALVLNWKPTFALGRYTAQAKLSVFGQPMEVLSTSFWVVPVLPVLIVLLAIFLVSFLVQYFFSRFEVRRK